MKNIAIKLHGSNVEIDISSDISISVCQSSEPANDAKPVLEWSKTLLDGESVNYEKAEVAIKALGEGWRMPTRLELESLIDLSRHDPAIDTEKYPDTKSAYYWTSTETDWNKDAVWFVGFGYGYVDSRHRGSSACVRAVRSSQ